MVYKPPHLPDEAAAVYAILKQKARELAARLPLPDFYRAHADDLACARHFLNHDPLLLELRGFVVERLEDDFGHGMKHALKVAADAGALSLIEGRRAGYAETRIQRISIVSQAAGLLRVRHDVGRERGLTRAFRAVNFHDSTARQSPDAERNVEPEAPRRNGFDFDLFIRAMRVLDRRTKRDHVHAIVLGADYAALKTRVDGLNDRLFAKALFINLEATRQQG